MPVLSPRHQQTEQQTQSVVSQQMLMAEVACLHHPEKNNQKKMF
jgi:hypothetical protein